MCVFKINIGLLMNGEGKVLLLMFIGKGVKWGKGSFIQKYVFPYMISSIDCVLINQELDWVLVVLCVRRKMPKNLGHPEVDLGKEFSPVDPQYLIKLLLVVGGKICPN